MQSLDFKSDMYMEKMGWVNPKMAAVLLSRRDSERFSFLLLLWKSYRIRFFFHSKQMKFLHNSLRKSLNKTGKTWMCLTSKSPWIMYLKVRLDVIASSKQAGDFLPQRQHLEVKDNVLILKAPRPRPSPGRRPSASRWKHLSFSTIVMEFFNNLDV